MDSCMNFGLNSMMTCISLDYQKSYHPPISIDLLSACDFSSDGKVLASAGFGRKPLICYMDTCDCITTSQSHSAPISEVRFQPGTNIFATSSSDKAVKLWDSNKPGTVLFDLAGHNGVVKSLDFHPFEGLLCSSDSFDVIEVWDLIQGVRMKNFIVSGQQIRFQPVSGKFLAVAKGNTITILDIQTWNVQNRFQGHNKEIFSMCWDAKGQKIASVTEDCARVWSIAVCGQCLHEYQSNGKRFQSIIFHPRYPNALVIGGFQNMELWIPETGQVYHIHAHTNATITGLAACPQNEFIASCSSDCTVKIWK
ncbi:transcriptional corepressor leunig protein [Medicago truncatula]|uniref:Transcriptional corepressor leunig protein n=1 Tax=Medicago truncatula TaxID=3880 RepID=A0A072UMW9_MEDTR|nr:transcriptional corepressor leunig protein [Medicago truncatula]